MTDQLEPQVAETQTAEAAEKPKRQKGETRNGVTIPGEGSKTRLVWDTASAISTEKGRPALSSEVHDALEGQVEKATVSTQYNRWCKFYGVSKEHRKAARDSLKPAPAPVQGEAAPVAPAPTEGEE